MTSPPPQWLTRKEAAALLRISVKTLDRRIAAGEIPSIRVGRSVRIARKDLVPAPADAAA